MTTSHQASAAQVQPATIADVMRIKNIIDVRISPDGSQVAWTASEADFQNSSYHFTVRLSRGDGNGPQLIGQGPSDVLPRWSPEGQQLAFVSRIPNPARLCLVNADCATVLRQFPLPEGVLEMAWSPDGSTLAFLAPGQAPAPRPGPSTPVNIRIVGQQSRGVQLYLLDLASGWQEQLTSEEGHLVSFSWSPDGRQILFARQPSSRENDWLDTRIFRVNLTTKQTTPLFGPGGVQSQPKWSPDGKWIAYVTQEETPRWLGRWVLCVVAAEGGTPSVVSRNFDDCLWNSAPDNFFWAPDSRRIYFTAEQGVTRQLFALDTGILELTPVTTGPYLHQLFSLSSTGHRMAFVIDRPSLPGEIHTSSTDLYRPKRLDALNPHLDGIVFGENSVVRWTSTDGREIEGLLIKPVGFQPGSRFPLITYLHGGPGGAFQQGFSPQVRQAQMEYCPCQVLAGRGYGIFCPNPRGSDGYGQSFRELVRQNWGEGDLDDVLSGIDYLIDSGLADPGRLGLIGYCYGAYLSLCALIRTQRFKAASVGASFADLYSLYGQSDLSGLFIDYFGDVPWKARTRYEKHSPIFAAHDIVTPVLFQHAENDRRVPWTQSLQVHNVLKELGVPTEFILYPRQEHLITDPRMNAECMRRNVLWFDQWLKALDTKH